MKRLTEITKSEIVDLLISGIQKPFDSEPQHIRWYGKLDDIKFLERLYNLELLPSYDSRFDNARGDIWQHTINNEDYEYDWVFSDDRFGLKDGADDVFLAFLCEMFHPVVIKSNINDFISLEKEFLDKFNVLLKEDGYALVEKEHISGRPIFIWRDISSENLVIVEQAKSLSTKFNSQYLKAQIEQMNYSVEANPTDAIGKAKELIESCCKTILEEKEIMVDKNWEAPKLMKETCKSLKLTPDDIPDAAKASDTIKNILSWLAAISHGIAELRNPYGSGHGKSAKYRGLSPRHARLAIGAATTAVYFLWETFEEQQRLAIKK